METAVCNKWHVLWCEWGAKAPLLDCTTHMCKSEKVSGLIFLDSPHFESYAYHVLGVYNLHISQFERIFQ